MVILSKFYLLYKGSYKDNKKNGLGKYIYANGDTFQVIFLNKVTFKDDKLNGPGKYIYANGDTFEVLLIIKGFI
jgi:hypothetical protein